MDRFETPVIGKERRHKDERRDVCDSSVVGLGRPSRVTSSLGSAMLQELSHMDRITQLQDEIQQLLTIMSSSIAYLTSKANFAQVSEDVPITKARNPEKVDPPDVFEENKKELVTDLIVKAKQVEYLINSLPAPEPEEAQAMRLQDLEQQMSEANEEYIRAVARARNLHQRISEVLRNMLDEADGMDNPGQNPRRF